MKLNYKILWIDDNIETLISLGIKDLVNEHLVNMEFISQIDCYETSKLAEETIKNGKYDLILSDFDVDDGDEKGDILIKKIRSYDIFTEVLFYSGLPGFNQTMIGVDRISFFSLEGDVGYKGFLAKIIRLIDQTVVKLQELPSIRGLVMTETSILDSLVENILTKFFNTDDKECDNFLKSIVSKIDSSLKSNFRNTGELKLSGKGAADVIKSRLFDASKKARTIEDLIILKKISDEKYKNFYERYLHEVIKVRNNLAHARSEVIDNVEYLIVDGDAPEKYDLEKCRLLRRNLKNYSNLLTELEQLLFNN